MPYALLPPLLVRWTMVAVLFLSVGMPVVHAESGEPESFDALGEFLKSATPLEPALLAESTPTPTRTVAAPVQERRVALVMGNNAYQHVNRLDNAVGDARTMAREYRSLGFDVIEKLDVDLRGMKAAVREFVQRIANGGVGAFFFAGHGVQEGGNNYLLPVDIGALTDPAALSDEAIELNADIMARIGQSGAKFSLLVIDACRDNPFPRRAGRGVGGTRGLAMPGTPDGMVVVYSAGVGQQALDRLDKDDRDPNGLFTREFIREIRKPGLEVAEVVRNVRQRVRDQAAKVKHEQTPAIYIQADRFYLIPDAGSVTLQTTASLEESLWAALDPTRPCEYQVYLDQYPQGRFADLAKLRLQDCRSVKGAKQAPVAPDYSPVAAAPTLPTIPAPDDQETQFWNEVKASGAREYLEAYLKQYPKGKYGALARIELQKVEDRDKAQQASNGAENLQAAARQRQEAQRVEHLEWKRALDHSSGTFSGAAVRSYLDRHPAKIEELQAAARKGSADAQGDLARMYVNGWGLARNYTEGLKWARKAAEQGNAAGQNSLGYLYHLGHGVTKSDTAAVTWYRKAAEQGFAVAQYNLGVKYLHGDGVVKSDTEAVAWFRKAAEQGHARGQTALGQMYRKGDGVAKSDTEAVVWYRKAAEQGDAVAQTNLGWLYQNGDGVAKSDAEAVAWYRKAAEQGLAGAQTNLGTMYQNGKGVAKSDAEAVVWYRKAAEQGDANAIQHLKDFGVAR